MLQETFPQFEEEYNAFPREKSEASNQYYFNNGLFGGTDALVLYAMVRHMKTVVLPQIEVV